MMLCQARRVGRWRTRIAASAWCQKDESASRKQASAWAAGVFPRVNNFSRKTAEATETTDIRSSAAYEHAEATKRGSMVRESFL